MYTAHEDKGTYFDERKLQWRLLVVPNIPHEDVNSIRRDFGNDVYWFLNSPLNSKIVNLWKINYMKSLRI